MTHGALESVLGQSKDIFKAKTSKFNVSEAPFSGSVRVVRRKTLN